MLSLFTLEYTSLHLASFDIDIMHENALHHLISMGLNATKYL